MSTYSLDLLTSLNELGLIITNVRSLASMDASQDKSGAAKGERDKTKKPPKKQQVAGVNTRARDEQQTKSYNRGQTNLRYGREDQVNSRPAPHYLAKASYGSNSPFGVRHRSVFGSKSSTPGKKRNKKSVGHAPDLMNSTVNPPTSASVALSDDVDEVDIDDDNDSQTFDVDCLPYNDVPEPAEVGLELEWNDEVKERVPGRASDIDPPRSGFAGRSRRTVSPYPYRLKLKKQNHDEWAIDEAFDWDEGSFFDDGARASPAQRFTELNSKSNNYKEENPNFRWHANESVEVRLDDLKLQDGRSDRDGDQRNSHLKPCLKKKTNDDQRHARNVSWNDDNNDFDTTADNDLDAEEDDGSDEVEENGPSHALAEERTEDIPDVSLLQTEVRLARQGSTEKLSAMKTPTNSANEGVSCVNTKEGIAKAESHSHFVIDDGDTDGLSKPNPKGERSSDISKCLSTSKVSPGSHRPGSLVKEWTDDAISKLTNDEKSRLIEEQEQLQIGRYDDPHLSRADRIKLLWEDCARKERLLHKLRPNVTSATSLHGGHPCAVVTPNVNRYSLYNY